MFVLYIGIRGQEVCEEQGCPGRAILRGVGNFSVMGGEIQRIIEHNHPIREGSITQEGA